MTLVTGTRLGPYEIETLLGAGGMGEVYKARDTRLDRVVALKILRPEFAADADRRQRFEREARATAALNHPNLLAVYDVGVEGDRAYVVSELLEGESLRQRLRGGPVPPRKAIEYAVQVAMGLAAAHDKGIVHRDLKPDNIFITADGRAKILDFGLARLAQTAPSGTDVVTMSVSQPGIIVGTLGYMSPEQVRGVEADARSDIFAFGVVLHEMLAGQCPFKRDTTADTLSAILNDDPPPLAEIGARVPPALERIMRRCIEKSPGERFQSARDLAFDLQSIGADSGIATRAGMAPARSRRGPMAAAVVVVLLVAVAASWFLLGLRTQPSPQPDMQRLTYRRGIVRDARFMPDGADILYSAAWDGDAFQVFSTRFDSSDSREYGLRDAEVLAVSRKGELALLTNLRAGTWMHERGTLSTLGPGGSPRPLLEDVVSADWTPDGTQLAAVRMPPSGRPVLEFPLNTAVYEGSVFSPAEVRVSPDGRMLAVLENAAQDTDYGRIAIYESNARKLTSQDFTNIAGLAWSSDGREVWFSAASGGSRRALYAVDLSGRQRLVLRVPGHLTLKDISRDGRVLVARDDRTTGIRALAPGATAERDLTWYSWSIPDAMSADGSTILFSEGGEAYQDRWGSYLRKTDGSPAFRLGDGLWGSLSDDGKWVVAQAQWHADRSAWGYLVLLPTGPGQPKRLTRPTNEMVRSRSCAFLPGSKGIVYISRESDKPARAYYLPIEGGTPAPITPEGVTTILPSPDGTAVIAGDASGRHTLYPVHGGPGTPLPDFAGRILGWHSDGKRLRVANPNDACTIDLVDPQTGKTEPWKRFRISIDRAGLTSGGCPTMFSADGNSYAYPYARQLSELYVMDGVR